MWKCAQQLNNLLIARCPRNVTTNALFMRHSASCVFSNSRDNSEIPIDSCKWNNKHTNTEVLRLMFCWWDLAGSTMVSQCSTNSTNFNLARGKHFNVDRALDLLQSKRFVDAGRGFVIPCAVAIRVSGVKWRGDKLTCGVRVVTGVRGKRLQADKRADLFPNQL